MVLAGGRGSRLGQLTDNRAKPAVPFGGKFRIIDFALSNCVNSRIRRIGVATQYKAQSLIQHLKCGWSFLDGRFGEFVDVLPAQQRLEDHWYRGTADAVYQNLDLLRRSEPELVLVLAGDHIYKMDYGRLIEAHLNKSADMTAACLETSIGEARAFGVMGIDADRRIVRFTEKPARPEPIPGRLDTALVSMGIYVLSAHSFMSSWRAMRRTPNPVMISVKTSFLTPFRGFACSRILSRRAASARRTGATSARSTPTGRPIWSSPGRRLISTFTMGAGRSGLTRNSWRQQSSLGWRMAPA